MTLWTVANIKGGQCKTTLATSLAAYMGVELLDANPENGDSFYWSQITGRPCRLVYPDSLDELEKAGRSKKLFVADCPPWEGLETRAALAHAKVALVPVASGFQDLRGLARMIDLIQEAREQANPRLRVAIVGTLRRSTNFAKTWGDVLQGYHRPKDGLYFLGTLPQRQPVVDAFGAGLPAQEAAGQAGAEVREFLDRFVAWSGTK